MFSRRHSQITEIQYLLVSEHDPVFIPFLPPADIAPAALKFLQFLPKDILQLDNAVNYFENANRLRMDNPYRFSILYLRSLQIYLENHTRNVVRLFMVNGSCKDIAIITETLKKNNRPLDYYFFYGKKIPFADFNNVVFTSGAFLTSLFENHKQIMHLIGAPAHQFLPHVDIYEREFYEVPSFVPAFGNHHMLNCLIGNFSYQPEHTASENDAMTEIKNISTKAHQSPESFYRLNIVVRSAKKIDAFFSLMRSKKIIHPVHDSAPIFAPLILIAPYQNPDIPDVLKHKNYSTPQPEMEALIKNLDFEQTRNYIHTGQDIRSKNIQMEMEITGRKLRYLDQIGTLHSSFTYSPVIRLPFQGKTLNHTLSPFRADEVHKYASEETRVLLNETINHFGVELASRTVSGDLEEKFLQENRQLVTISDMPFEWLNIQDIPIAFTHDIARMPETALHGLMALFMANEQFVYTVPRDILKKTLVIFGSDDMPFLPWRFHVMEMAETHGFKTAICLSVKEAVAAIKKHKPDFLIFDCHGGYDAENKTSYLMLGEEQLTGELIVKHDISAPLVFLCACNTAPTYGTNNTIANAFFETHSLSVTTTYLPIEITSSTTLYIRLLNNLLSASTQPLHCNWLNFLSHVIRTSYISETIKRFEGSKSGRASKHEIIKKQTLLFTRSMIFHERRKVFEELKNMITTIDAEIDSPAITVIPEYLFYSNLGRSDLIRFEVYEVEFAKKNKR